jgi:hypothetical protein
VNPTTADPIAAVTVIAPSAPIASVARAAVILAALYVAFAIGTPWLLYDAPPSAEDVIVSCRTAQPLPARVAAEFGGAAPGCRNRALR